MEALKASVAAAKKGGEDEKPAAKTSVAKKKAAAKKPAAKKPAAEKPEKPAPEEPAADAAPEPPEGGDA
jgi:hypothetical protein